MDSGSFMNSLLFGSSQNFHVLPILAWRFTGHAKIKIVHQSSDFDSFALAFCFAIRIALAYCSFRYRMNAGVIKD
jgi:hypothetical protein